MIHVDRIVIHGSIMPVILLLRVVLAERIIIYGSQTGIMMTVFPTFMSLALILAFRRTHLLL